MSDNNTESPSPVPAGSALADSGVPGLIDQYRQQRKAWLAQADELVRLRDEVRSAAEREAIDIVTIARRDVRQIVVAARRELMVLTAQLHAAMEAVDQSAVPPAAFLDNATAAVGAEVSAAQSSLGVTRELVLGARREVRGVLDEARAEIEALASEASIPFPDQETAPALPEPLFFEEAEFEEAKALPTPKTPRIDRLMSEDPVAAHMFADSTSVFSESDEISFPGLSRPARRIPFGFGIPDSNESQAPRVRPALMYVGLFAAAGMIVTTGTLWWIFSGDGSAAREPEPAPAAVTAPPVESGVGAIERPSLASASATGGLSLVIEARRPSWLRASIDGQADGGRLYQAGEKKEIVGARSVVIRAGDAGAVYVSVNGAQAQPLGANGAVMTRRYAIDEAQPTAQAAPGRAESRSGDNRQAPIATPANQVRLAVENGARPTATRADVRTTGLSAAPGPASAASATPRDPASNNGSGSPRPGLVVAGQQWLDAYQRRDREAMSTTGTDNVTVTDERSTSERFSSWQNGVQRELDQVELALTGDTALLTARMTERAEGAAPNGPPQVSRVSQIWVRRAGQWKLADVRIIAENRLNQVVR